MQTYCPYRICPLGAHIDHQYGVVSGAAINLGILFDYEKLPNTQIQLQSLNYTESCAFDINDILQKENKWYDYFKGIIARLRSSYKLKNGLKGTFKADLPSGGISSSSASQIAFLTALHERENSRKENIIEAGKCSFACLFLRIK